MTDSIGYGLWQSSGKTTMWVILQVRSTPKLELNCYDWLDKMRSITKTRRDNNVTDCKGVISVKYDTELSRLIGQCAVYDEDETGQWLDRSYKLALHWKWNLNYHDWSDRVWSMIKPNWTMMWRIIQVGSTPKSELNCHYRSNMMRSITKSRHDNEVMDRTSVIFV